MAILTSYWGLDVILVLFLFYIGLYMYVTRNFSYWKKRGIKVSHPPVSFFGSFAQCIFARQTPEAFVRAIYNAGKGEQVMGYYVLDKPHLLIRDPEIIKHILVKDSSNFLDRHFAGNPDDTMSSMNVFLVKNPEWKPIRQMLTPIFTTGKIKVMFQQMLAIGKDLDNYLESLQLNGDGRDIDMADISGMFMTDLIGSAAYNMRFNSLTDPNAEVRMHGKSMFRSTYRRYLELLTMFFMPEFLKLLNANFFDAKSTDFVRHIFSKAIEERKKSGEKRSDLINLLIELEANQKKEPEKYPFKLEGDALLGQAAIFFTGGFETSSVTLSFALYEMARNPDMQERLRREILDALNSNNGEMTYDMLMTLPYVHMVISETLRLYPITPIIDRLPERDYRYPGSNIIIPKGIPVLLPMRAVQVDPEHFPNPEKFDPERFNEENKKNIKPYTYFPFGDGPRACIGMRIGMMQTKLGLIHVLKNYELRPCSKTVIPPVFDNLMVFTRSKYGNVLNVRKIATNVT